MSRSYVRSVAPLRGQSVMPCLVPAPSLASAVAVDAVAVLVSRAVRLHRAGHGAAGLLECFSAIPDPRASRGIRHSLATILGLCTAAVLSSCVTLTDITAWITGADEDLLAAVGCRRGADGRCQPPHPDTVERVLAALGAQDVADGVGAFLARRAGVGCVAVPVAGPVLLPAIAVDGKAVRGAIGVDGQVPYLLAAATHGESVVIGERLVGAKTNEVPEFAPLLRGLAVEVGGVCVHHGCRAHRALSRDVPDRTTVGALRDDRQTQPENAV